MSATLLVALALVPQSTDPFPPASPESVGLKSENLEALADVARSYVDRGLALGAELHVIQDRRTVLHRSFGLFDREAETPWENGAVCNIRSMTKPLTGAALQILIDRELIAEADRVADYLPGFDTDAAREITVAQILSHRAGLPLSILTTIDEFPNLLEMADAVGERGPEFPPESRFWYSDSGTDVVGALVELASGVSLDEFVTDELLKPLGMETAFYYLDGEDPRRDRIPTLYMGGGGNWQRLFDPSDGPLYPFAWGSQSIYATTTDYARFLCMWMDEGMANGERILSEDAIRRQLTPVSEMSMLGSSARFPTSFDGLEVWYGQMSVLHVPVGSNGEASPVIVGHSGSDGTIAWAFPERDLIVLYFTQSRGGGSALRLESAIQRYLLSDGDGEPEPPSEELAPFVGTYVANWVNHRNEEFVVSASGDALSLDIPTQMVFELVPAPDTEEDAPRKWHFAVTDSVTVWFERDADGNVDCLRVHQGSMTFEAPRLGTPHLDAFREEHRPDPERLAPILGTYHDPIEDADFAVEIAGDDVRIVEGENTFHLWEAPGERWIVRENPAMTITFQDEDGRVVSLTRSGPGGATVMPRVE